MAKLAEAREIVVVGAGFIGLESKAPSSRRKIKYFDGWFHRRVSNQ